MANTTLKLTRSQAVELHNIINVMTGSANYKLLRSQIQENILELWPEIRTTETQTSEDEVRPLSVSSREQKALAEGLLTLINKKDTSGQDINGAEFNFLFRVAKTCKVSKWLGTQFNLEEIPDFDEDLDDEVPVNDDEAAEEGKDEEVESD